MTSNAHIDLLKAVTMNVSRQRIVIGAGAIDVMKRKRSGWECLCSTQPHPASFTP
jgi:hypothetical protein